MHFSTVSVRSGGSVVLTVVGDCDLAAVPELRRQLRSAGAQGPLVVDLGAVSILDSVCLGLLVGANRRFPGMVILAGDGPARRTLEATGLDRVLDLRATMASSEDV